MSSFDHLILHIGVPKTGSSLIQKVLRTLDDPLRRLGLVYVDRSKMLPLPGYRAWTSGRDEQRTKADFVAALVDVVRDLRSQESKRPGTVLISNEAASGHHRDFESPFWERGEGAVSEIIEVLQPATTEIVLYVRRQDRLLESLYMERIHRGRVIEWPAFRDRVCSDDRVRYTELIEAVSAIPTVTQVRVRPFELIGAGAPAFVGDFLDGLGVSALLQRAPARAFSLTNPSYTQPAWEAAMKVNPLLETTDQTTRFRRFIRELFPADKYPKAALLTDDERGAMISRYADENTKLFGRYLPEFPVDSYVTSEGTKRLGSHLKPVEVTGPKAKPSEQAKKVVPPRVRRALGAARDAFGKD